MKLRILLTLLTLAGLGTLSAQNRLKPYEEYIAQYADIALEQQQRHGIPASITLAQGLLESGAGKSELAKASNNHFGIKCHNTWKGKTAYAFDDGQNSCFRKYDDVSDSYEDHSMFLVNGARYRFLFQLDLNDYKGWAKGLQKAGYATDPQYADKLIRVIETYDLNQYTKGSVKKATVKKEKEPKKPSRKEKERALKKSRTVHVNNLIDSTILNSAELIQFAKDYHAMELDASSNRINPLTTHLVDYVGTTPCITVKHGDSFASIGEEFGVSARRLRKINDVDATYKLSQGERIFLDSKTSWWEGENPTHIVKAGETMHSLSQTYALKLDALYKLNDMKPGTSIKPGQRIKLRNPDQLSPFMRSVNQVINAPDSTKTAQ